MPDTCIHGRRVSQSCPGCGNARAAERPRTAMIRNGLESAGSPIGASVRAATPDDPHRDTKPANLVYRVTIPGNPGAAAVNARSTPYVVDGHSSVKLTKPYRQWQSLAIPLMRRAAAAHPSPEFVAGLRTGAIVIEVNAYWPRQHQQGEAKGLAWGDVDAAIKACLDALRKPVPPKPPKPGKKRGTPGKPGAHIITDDAQAKRAVLDKHVDAREPRIEIEVRRAP